MPGMDSDSRNLTISSWNASDDTHDGVRAAAPECRPPAAPGCPPMPGAGARRIAVEHRQVGMAPSAVSAAAIRCARLRRARRRASRLRGLHELVDHEPRRAGDRHPKADELSALRRRAGGAVAFQERRRRGRASSSRSARAIAARPRVRSFTCRSRAIARSASASACSSGACGRRLELRAAAAARSAADSCSASRQPGENPVRVQMPRPRRRRLVAHERQESVACRRGSRRLAPLAPGLKARTKIHPPCVSPGPLGVSA